MPLPLAVSRRRLLLLGLLALGGCATRIGSDGRQETTVDAKFLVKSDTDRVIDAARAEVVAGLLRLTEKLYRRNPRELKKGAAGSDIALAVRRLQQNRRLDFPELDGARGGAVARRAFDADYAGDRVLALMAGLLGMAYAAFEDKEDFYLFDELDAQKLHDCARNLEIAVWKLASSVDAAGQPLILSNEIAPGQRNLSFEREFGRIIGLLDFLARIVADKHGRILSRVAQNMATAVFLPIGGI